LDIVGRELYGRRNWAKIRYVVQALFSNPNLSSSLPGMTRGQSLSAPPMLNGLLDKKTSVSGTARILHLRHLRTDDQAELNPVNETTTQVEMQEQFWSGGGLQPVAGMETGAGPAEVTGDIMAGPTYRRRGGDITGSSGRVLSNGKFASPTA